MEPLAATAPIASSESEPAPDSAADPSKGPEGDSAESAPLDALTEAIVVHHGRLTGLAYVMCGDRTLAEDIVADAYARVWPKVRDEQVDDLMPYLRSVVVNQVQGRRRRRRLELREAERSSIARTDLSGGFEPVVDEQLCPVEALLCLPIDHRTVIVLRHVEDLSERDTAEVLGISPGTVKSRLARGLAALRELLGETAESGDDDDD